MRPDTALRGNLILPLGVQPAPGLPTSGDGILPGSRGMDPAKAEDLEKQLSAVQAEDDGVKVVSQKSRV